jgi:3-hydroxyisobutyrate dehydrogenase
MQVGWIGMGRMGTPMAARLARGGYSLKVWNRTRAKAEPLVADGAEIVSRKEDLRGVDVLFTMLSTGKDLADVCFGDGGVATGETTPKLIVDCSTIGVDESAEIRRKLADRKIQYLSAPVSGNPRCVIAGFLSSVVSGPKDAFDKAEPLIRAYAVRGVSYVGEGELARICKIAHNMFLAVVLQNLIEVTLLAHKKGVSRHAFLDFMNNSALGSIFTRYKSPALVNLDFTTTFTMALQCKDIDLGLVEARKLGVVMPATVAMREVFQSHFGVAASKSDPEAYLAKDFSAVLETMALYSGMHLESENVPVKSGLEVA